MQNTMRALAIAIALIPAGAGRADTHRLDVAGAKLVVTIDPGPLAVQPGHVLEWVQSAATAVTRYLGKFPVSEVTINVANDGCNGVHKGLTLCGKPPTVWVTLGMKTTPADLRADDVMTHEMMHLAFPNVDQGCQGWAAEGLATYGEALARLGAGRLDRDGFWKYLAGGLAQASGGAAERGLDHTSSSKQRYWSGALFWLLADVQIRQQTGMRRTLADALRGIAEAGGSVSAHWPMAQALAAGDRAVGVPVLAQLHARMSGAPPDAEAREVCARLGVKVENGALALDDTAPLAKVRRAIESAGVQFTRR